MKHFLHPLFFFLLSTLTFAQNGYYIYDQYKIHTIEVSIDLPSWFDTLELDYKQNAQFPDSIPEVYRLCQVKINGELIPNCGIREKGNSSNTIHPFNAKKPFKISFNAFDDDQTFDDLKKLNLNNFTNDPSLLHEAATYKILREFGVIAPRTSWAKLYVNDIYYGLYGLVENVDKTFLKDRYGSGNHKGNLYKTNREARVFLDWLGSDYEDYKKQGLKLNTNEEVNDWSQHIAFVDFLNNSDDETFFDEIESRFDVHIYLKILAVEKCVRSWDSYWGGGNNFYLYEHPDGMIRWIPWDVNETFQDMKRLKNTKLLQGYLVPTTAFDERPLLRRIFESEAYFNEYLDNVCELNKTIFSVDYLSEFLTKSHDLAAKAYFEDPNKFNSYEQFQNSLWAENTDELIIGKSAYAIHITYPAIFEFVQSQRIWVKDQMKGWDFSCDIDVHKKRYDLLIYPNPADQQINISYSENQFDFAHLTIFNSVGQMVYTSGFREFGEGNNDIDISELPVGFYVILKQDANGNLGVGKMIVE